MPDLYQRFIRPLVFKLDAETAHEIGISILRAMLATRTARRRFESSPPEYAFGEIRRFGLRFPNPLGIAAGFDKNGEVVDQLASLGFGFVEVGTVTCRPQPGNEKPRLFRLPADDALINRLGFNNEGGEQVAERLRKAEHRCVIGVNIGRNKDVPNEEATADYLAVLEVVHGVADYIAINVSSPNTPNLRELQRGENLEELLQALADRNRALSASIADEKEKPLLVKIAPDLSEAEIETITDISLRTGIAGIIATNTTVSREGLRSAGVEAIGPGGLSGRPLAARSDEVIRKIYRYSKGKLPIIGVGGIFTPDDAFRKIAAGASLLQAYTGFVYHGPTFPRKIVSGLSRILKEKGFRNLDEAVGSDN